MNKSSRRPGTHRHSGFSLVEMIGVLAIIAILAVVIVPKVFSTIAASRVTNAVASITSIKTAVAEYAGKHGTIPLSDAQSRIDDLLVAAGMLESRFSVKIGTQQPNPPLAGDAWNPAAGGYTLGTGGVGQGTQSRIICVTSAPAAVPGTAGTNYQLDSVNNLPAGARVISAVIVGLTATESRELSLRIDGDSATPSTTGIADTKGKVTYAAAGTTAYVYITHQ
jgi:prepilin-type N-terminal cleavage/methylation domain-containing protein